MNLKVVNKKVFVVSDIHNDADRNHDDYRYLVSKLEQCGLKISDHTIDKERKRGQGVKEY